jgi:hypothetical protein
MSVYKFEKNDVLRNTLIVHPKIHFKINKQNLYYNNIKTSEIVQGGYASINDLNMNSSCDPGLLDFSCADISAYVAII